MTFTAYLAHRRVRVFLAVYCIALLAFTLSACGGGDPEPEPPACLDPHQHERH